MLRPNIVPEEKLIRELNAVRVRATEIAGLIGIALANDNIDEAIRLVRKLRDEATRFFDTD